MDTLVTTYLEMTSAGSLQAAYTTNPAVQVIQSHVPLASFYRFLYHAVGHQWRWYDRNAWSDDQLTAYLAQPNVSLYVLTVAGTPAGYIELEHQADTGTEIAYFGLIEQFIGQGYGKHLLSFGVQRAWDAGAKRVWLHTCNLDGEHALRNYQKRGFTIYDVKEQPMPELYKT